MITILYSSMVRVDITSLRNQQTSTAEFRQAMNRLSLQLAAEAGRHIPTIVVPVTTPIEEACGHSISGNIIIVPILRAGLSMLDAFLTLFPMATLGFIGMKRNEETLAPDNYYRNLPPITEFDTVIVLDPMIATGGSAKATVTVINEYKPNRVILASAIASHHGLQELSSFLPELHIIVAQIDNDLNNQGFIVPGLGDAGDRYVGNV